MADDVTRYDEVEGYAGTLSYRPGEVVTLHTSSRSALFDVRIERRGASRELVWEVTGIAGIEHALPVDADANGCGWPVTVEVPVPASWRSGFYVVTFVAHDGPEDRRRSRAGFVVRAAEPSGRPLLVLATNTWNAYNNWGGRSLYTGGHQVSFRRPWGRGLIERPGTERDDRKARPRYRREEPDADGTVYQGWRHAHGYPGYMASAGWFTYERRFVEWAEFNGIEMDYAISADLHEPGALDGYGLVLGVGHDEYWAAPQRDAIEAHIAGGGNYASFSGNTCFWQVRLVDDGDHMLCHKYKAHLTDPVMATDDHSTMTGMWADPEIGRPETGFLGAGSAWGLYSRFGQATPRGSGAFTVYRNDHWMFEGTGLRYGDLLGADDGVVGYETVGCRITFDDYQLPVRAGGDGTPEDLQIVAFTPSSNLAMGEYPRSIAALDDQGDLEFVAGRLHGRVDADSLARHRYGNAVMTVCRPNGADGGEVVAVGSTDWVFGLAEDPLVGHVTRNIVAHLTT